METVQERELLQLQLQGWPSFHAMPASFDAGSGYTYSGSSISSVGGNGFLLGWEPPFGCFVAADAQLHDLFPLCVESLPVPPAATSTAHPTEASHGAAATPTGELGDFFLVRKQNLSLSPNFWNATGAYDEQPVAISSSCVLQQLEHEKGSAATATTSNPFLYDDDDDDPLGSIFSKRPTLPTVPVFPAPAEEQPLLSSSSSSSHGDAGPHGSDGGGGQTQDASTNSGPSGAPAPPPCSSSLKRATPEASESTEAECSQSGGGKRPKTEATTRVLCPFAVLKPDGLDGGATLADINARILMRPARPVRHPVGEYACAPRALAVDVPGISGRAVSGFARLHTAGRGTITIMRTRG
ncbi:putative protein TPRXL [Lolium rigidum]|uniref:putative protein TPRXL n=1 Tax=Lolium rigidum TaxID=89674 RepID=UPI001F5D135C|nr:putative protein TPRXL [Lolium rigidum]